MNFEFPDLDISFEKVVVKKASAFIHAYLSVGALLNGYLGTLDRIKHDLNLAYYDLPSETDRFVFIREILIHIAAIKAKYNEDTHKNMPSHQEQVKRTLDRLENANDIFDDFTHCLAGLLIKEGYNLDKNAFSDQEVNAVHHNLEEILLALQKLQAGQEILYEGFEAMKSQIEEEFRSLKSEIILGKKTFFQLALGKVGSYAGNKAADSIFEMIKPQLGAFFATQASHILNGFHKFLP